MFQIERVCAYTDLELKVYLGNSNLVLITFDTFSYAFKEVAKGMHTSTRICKFQALPVSQFTPVHPARQLHVYSLTPSVHAPPFRQGWLSHSLISIIGNIEH